MRLIRLIVVTCLGGLLPSAAIAQTIVWTDLDARKIQRKDVNGGAVQTIVEFPSPQAAYQIYYDPVTAKLYYRLSGTGSTFQRANLDGSDPENISTPSVGTFSLNVGLRKLHWIVGYSDVLNRSELDGTGVESHTYPACCVMTIEAVGNELFFGAGLAMQKGIWRANADGSNEQYIGGMSVASDMAYDPVENRIYVGAAEAVFRMNPDGTALDVLAQTGASQIVVDSLSRKVYWAQRTVIHRSNLDGSNVEEFVTASDVGNPGFDLRGLTIVYNSLPIPTMSGWGLMAMTVLFAGSGMLIVRKLFNLKRATNVQ